MRSLSRTVSMVPLHGSATIARVGVERSRTPVAMTVTPHTRSQLSSALHRARKNTVVPVVHDKDRDVQKEDKNGTERSLPSLENSKSRKPQNNEFEDVLSAFCKASGEQSAQNSPKNNGLSNTAPPSVFGSVRPSAQSPESAAEPEVSMVRRTMLHAARGLVRRISLEPQVIC